MVVLTILVVVVGIIVSVLLVVRMVAIVQIWVQGFYRQTKVLYTGF